MRCLTTMRRYVSRHYISGYLLPKLESRANMPVSIHVSKWLLNWLVTCLNMINCCCFLRISKPNMGARSNWLIVASSIFSRNSFISGSLSICCALSARTISSSSVNFSYLFYAKLRCRYTYQTYQVSPPLHLALHCWLLMRAHFSLFKHSIALETFHCNAMF